MHPQAESTPPRQSKSLIFEIFEEIGGDLGGGRSYLGSFSVCFKSDDCKKVNFLGEEKCTPRQNPGYVYDWLCQSQYRPSAWVIGEDSKTSSNSIGAAEVHSIQD